MLHALERNIFQVPLCGFVGALSEQDRCIRSPVRGRCGTSQRRAAGGCWGPQRLQGLREPARRARKGLLPGALATRLGPPAPRFLWKLAKRNSLFPQESAVWRFLSCLGQISTVNVKLT